MSPDPKAPTGGHHDENGGNDAERDVQFLRDALRPYDIAAFDRGVRPARVERAQGRARTTGLWAAGIAAAVAAVITVPVVIGQNGSADPGPAGTGGAGTVSSLPGTGSSMPGTGSAVPAPATRTGPFQQVTWQASWLADDGRPASPITYQRWSSPEMAMLQWSDADHPQETFCFAGYAVGDGTGEQGSGPAFVIDERGVPGGSDGPDLPATEVLPGDAEAGNGDAEGGNGDAVLTDEVVDPGDGAVPSPEEPAPSPEGPWNSAEQETDAASRSGGDHHPCPTANRGFMLVDPFGAEVPVAAPEMAEFLLDGSNVLGAFEGSQGRPAAELTASRAADAATMLVFERHLTADQQAALATVVLDLTDDPARVAVPGADEVLAVPLDGGEGIGGHAFSPDVGYGNAVLLVSGDRHSVVGTGLLDGTELASWNLITDSGITDVPPAGF